MNDEFGKFIMSKRKEKGITLLTLAEKLGKSSVYICDIEKGRRYAPDKEQLGMIAELLKLTEDETAKMYDLAARTRESVPLDLAEYLINNEEVRVALRKAKKNSVDWNKINFD